MNNLIPKQLKILADNLNFNLYITGGFVRNYIAFNKIDCTDIDICAPASCQIFIDECLKFGFTICSVFPRTETVKIKDSDGFSYEFSSFRCEEYLPFGSHTPSRFSLTTDITKDATRRDFKCNAIYYDIKNNKFIDPLGGVKNIKDKILDTVTTPDSVFKFDGLRLLRLIRFYGELDFTPTKEVLIAAKKFRNNLLAISAERIYSELLLILNCDEKYGNFFGAYKALELMKDTLILEVILPELFLGNNMPQRADFHNYDVLEHSLRTVKYSSPDIRLYALLHDIGKPRAFLENNNFYTHEIIGENIVTNVLRRLKAPKETINIAKRLIKLHMIDLKGDMKENKIKLLITQNLDIFNMLLKLKQADFSACKDDISVCPTVLRWTDIYNRMKKQNTPLSLKDLQISGKDLLDLNIEKTSINTILQYLFKECIYNPTLNQRETLIQKAINFKNIK